MGHKGDVEPHEPIRGMGVSTVYGPQEQFRQHIKTGGCHRGWVTWRDMIGWGEERGGARACETVGRRSCRWMGAHEWGVVGRVATSAEASEPGHVGLVGQ